MRRILPVLSLFALVFKRLRHHLGLSVSSIIGIFSIFSLVVCVPVFANGVLSQVLKEQLTEKALRNHRSLFSIHLYYPDNLAYQSLTPESAQLISQHLRNRLENGMGLEVREIVHQITSLQLAWNPVKVKSARPAFQQIYLSFFNSDILAEKVKIVEGRWPQAEESVSDPIPVAVLEDYADDNYLNVGDIYTAQGITVKLVGIFRPIDLQDQAWFYDPEITFRDEMWVPIAFFEGRLQNLLERPVNYASWYAIVEDRSLRFSHSQDYTRQMIRLDNEIHTMLPKSSLDYSPQDMLAIYEDRLNALMILFFAAASPVLVLALLFSGLVAAIAVGQYELESAVIAARGGSAWQMIALNLAESLALIAMALPPALAMGFLAAILMGQTQLFLQFTRRPGYAYSLGDVSLSWLFLAALAVVLARLAPLGRGLRPSLLSLKQERARSTRKPVWERYYLDLLLLIPGIYAYFAMRGRTRSIYLTTATEGGTARASGTYDPLLFLASSIFALSLCMLALRLVPLGLRLLGAATSRLHQAWAYLAVQEIARQPGEHASAMLLIMISLSFSILSASMARTLDRWLVDSQYYLVGADLVVKEYAMPREGASLGGAPQPAQPDESAVRTVESLVSLERHLKLPEISSATYVGKWSGKFSYGAEVQECTIMGIDRLTFPGAAFYRRDFSDEALGALLNALAAQTGSVLLPESLAEETGLQTGDRLRVEADIGIGGERLATEAIVAGFYRYFPTVYPSETPTLIANLDTLFGTPEAVTGVDVWLRLRPGAGVEPVLAGLRRMAIRDLLLVEVRGNALDEVAKGMRRPEWVGLFGVLNVGFLLTGLLPGIGFVLYSFASLRMRLIGLGILQALGLSTLQAAGGLLLEKALLMSAALACGAAVGFITSRLFLPFLQVGQAGAFPVPPFVVHVGWGEAAWLCVGFGLLFLLTLAGMMISLTRMKIFQAVKMGEAV